MWTLGLQPTGRPDLPGGLQAKTQKLIGSLGHALDFRTIGNLGNDLLFVNIGILGNCSAIAKNANDFGWLHAFGDGEGTQPPVIGNIGKIVMLLKLA